MVKNVSEIYSPPAYEKANQSDQHEPQTSFGEALENAISERRETDGVKPPEKKEESYWEIRQKLIKKHFEQRDELYKKKQIAKLREAQEKLTYGDNYKRPVPTLSAAEILFDLLMGGGL